MPSSSSEEEGEIVPDYVSNYYFVDSEGEPISFSCLPLKWNDNKGEQKLESTKCAFLRGMVEDGHQLIYRKVIAWKFLLSYALPEIYALLDAKSERWIKLQRPRKSYEDTIRSLLISVHCLHFMKKNPEEESGEALWKNIRRTFSTYEVPPSENDLLDHMPWIKEAVLRDKDIAKAKNLPTFLSEVSGKRKALCEENRAEKKPKFIVDRDDVDIHNYDDLSDAEQDELFDCVCAFCDDGGELLGCEGRCIRSFHPTIESGAASSCESLRYSSEQVDAIQTFLCKNCQYQQHQCFICGRLGSSDKSSGAKVFACVSATCGHFYHPRCISELVFPGNENQAQELQKQIEAGDSFTCPAHKCFVCKQGEDKNVYEMQFAVCRRCPKAYHRKCLPKNISFQRNDVKDIPQRAWEGLLTKRILIYCTDHKICRNTLTPKRDHVVFPCIDRKKEQDKLNVISVKRSNAYGIWKDETKVESSKNFAISEGRKPNMPSTMEKTKLPCRSDQSVSMPSVKKVPAKAMVGNLPSESTRAVRTAEMEKRIQRLIENSVSSFNVEEFLEQKRKCTHVSSPHYKVEKTITMGKIECSVQAIQEALKILQEGGTIKDAKAVCEPAVLSQIVFWKKKMGGYLAPFLHGLRYTSFGRHFTKVDKLKQVVNRLCWYVQHGDMIVDFCCGSNDFNCLMKEELDRMGIQCSFKNYDLIQPKNDFNFEKRDWMSVQLEELPEGSKLIMGLNPPFGMNASLANQFIDKALKFRPKLLILIVPKETQRLDRKKTPYDLVWEDDQILSGKSFYLPGSVDVHDQQMEQWNLIAPPLYLWSRPDWTAKHKELALEQGHLIKTQNTEYSGGIRNDNAVSNYLMEENQDCYRDFSSVADGYNDINCILEDLPEPSDDI